MISEIRVKARAASADEAQREIETILMAANQVAYLEGLGSSSVVSDNNFSQVYSPDAWNAEGMTWEGRMSYKFEPERNPGGGLREFGFQVIRTDRDQISDPELLPSDDGEDVTAHVIVLSRAYPVTRDQPWPLEPEPAPEDASTEAILDNIRRLENVKEVTTDTRKGWWTVVAQLDTGAYASGCHPSLRDAALDCYGKCGVEVTHFLTATPGAAKPTQPELMDFTALARDEDVQDISFGRAKSRDGWEIELSYAIEATGGSNSGSEMAFGVGGRRTVYGESFGDALQAAKGELAAARRQAAGVA